MKKLIYQSSPIVTLATNNFINIPVIFQYEKTPLIEIVYEQSIGYTSKIPIYHPDGTYLAKVNGTRVYPTEDGKKAGITMNEYSDQWICKMDDKTIFEVHHQKGDSFKLFAELYTPDGCFVKFEDNPKPSLINITGNDINVGGVSMSGCTFNNLQIGIWLKKDGSCLIGCS